MIIIGENSQTTKATVDEKLRELCEAILQDEGLNEARDLVEGFLSNPVARQGYTQLAELGERLHQRQHAGEELTKDEIKGFEKQRQQVFSDPNVQAFSAARQELQGVEEMVSAFVSKTLELGRMPMESDFAESSGCCNSGGCGCH